MVQPQPFVPTRALFDAGGRVQSGEADWFAGPVRSWTGSNRPPGLIYCHGAGTWTSDTLGSPYMGALARKLSQYFTVVLADLGGDMWGNDTHIARIGAARTYLISNGFLAAGATVTLVGVSMGGGGSLAYARANPTHVRAVAGVIPVADLVELRAIYPASVDAAYPPTYNNTTDGPTHNPVSFANGLVSGGLSEAIPIRIFSSSTDVITTPTSHTKFCNRGVTPGSPGDPGARALTTMVNIGSNGHSDTSVGDATEGVIDFCLHPGNYVV